MISLLLTRIPVISHNQKDLKTLERRDTANGSLRLCYCHRRALEQPSSSFVNDMASTLIRSATSSSYFLRTSTVSASLRPPTGARNSICCQGVALYRCTSS